jgi:hypothetical protein
VSPCLCARNSTSGHGCDAQPATAISLQVQAKYPLPNFKRSCLIFQQTQLLALCATSAIMPLNNSSIDPFLQEPFKTWTSTIIYLGGCVIIVLVIYFIGHMYYANFHRQPTRRTRFELDPRPRETGQRYARSPYPRHTGSDPGAASSNDNGHEAGAGANQDAPRVQVARESSPAAIRVRSVNESHIAERRRLSGIKKD